MRIRSLLLSCVAALAAAACFDPPADVPWDAAGPVDAADGGLRPDPDAPDGGGATTLVVSATSLDLAEASQATFTVALGEAPADDVVVTLTSADPDRLIAEPATLTFTAADHDQPQTVALSARPDDDAVDDAVAVTVAAVGAADVTVDVAIADDDTLGFAITPGLEVDVGEGTSTTVHVALTAAPPGPVAVAVASMSPAEATVAPDALSFDADTWATPQTVTITGTQDVDTSDDGATVTVTAAGLAPASIAVTVVDDDVLGIVLSSTNLGTIAEGTGGSFTVALTQQPPADVTIEVDSNSLALTASPDALVFSPSNWSQPQTVTVSAPQDVDTADASVMIALVAEGVSGRWVAATVVDDDVQAIVVEPGSLALTEGGDGQLAVHLAYAPTEPFTVSVASLAIGVAQVSSSELTFTAADYGASKYVTVSARQDQDLADGATTIRFQNLAAGLSTDAAVTVDDDDTQVVVLQVSNGVIDDGGSVGATARLGYKPGGPVTVTVTTSPPGHVTPSSTELAFTTSNWNTDRPFTLAATPDDDLVDQVVTVTASAPGATSGQVAVTAKDHDTQEVLLMDTSATIFEEESVSVGVTLKYRPTGTQTINIVPQDYRVTAPASVTFDASTWDVAHAVTLTAVHDDDAENQYNLPVTFQANGVTGKTFQVSISDLDTLHAVFGVESIVLGEPFQGVANVRLSNRVFADTTLRVYTSNDAYATTSPDVLTFTADNWAIAQTVWITPVQDDDDQDANIFLNGWIEGVSLEQIPLTIEDWTVIAGYPGPYPNTSSDAVQLDTLYLFPFTPPRDMQIDHLAAQMGFVNGGQARLAIYGDASGRPGNLFRWTGAFTPVTYQLSDIAPDNGGQITGGTPYWIGIQADAGMFVRASAAATATRCEMAAPFADGLPPSFADAGTCGSSREWQIYTFGIR
ncbi:MAG: hypothetical protein H6708_17335 [Kofleriaceae bacterium]|nr:hypothetical protein [Myxococcales bacterium]MCB9562171.1 hypothetical protein [Kofleriaceae bacterium]